MTERTPDAGKTMADREMLELAAKAAGIAVCTCSDGPYHYSSCPMYKEGHDPFAALGKAMHTASNAAQEPTP